MKLNFNQNLFKNPLALSIASLIAFSITGCDSIDSFLGDRGAIDVTSGAPLNTTGTVVEPGVETLPVSGSAPEGSASDSGFSNSGVTFPGGTANSITPDNPEVRFQDSPQAPNPGIETQPVTIPEPAGVLGLLALGLGSIIQREISR